MNELVTIIVPIYNVEKYLKKCIESILNQTYKKLEIILVDDGNLDSCGKICDEYSLIDNRIKVIHKKNGGLSEARNFGIDSAKGEYITFIDADDYMDEKFVENIMKIALKTKADLVISGLKDVYEYQKNVYPDNSEYYEELSKEQAYRKVLLQEEIDVSANAKLYKREIFKNLRYPVGELYEDIKIIDKLIEKADTIVYTKYKGYFYLQRAGSIMYSPISEKKFVLIETVENLLKFIEKKYPNIKNVAVRRYVYCNYHILGRAILDNNYYNMSKNLRNNILKYENSIFKENIYSTKEKIATAILKLGLKPYKFFWKIYSKIKSGRNEN